MSKKIYITHTDDVSAEEAVECLRVALWGTKPNMRVGIIEFSDKHFLSFNDKAKNLSVHVWKEKA